MTDRRLPRVVGDGTDVPVGVTVPRRPGRQPHLPRHRRLAVRGHAEAAVRHQARRRSTTASRSCRCSTSSPTCRSRPRLRGLVVDDINFSDRPALDDVRREGRRAVRPGRHLRLRQPAGVHRRVRLQRHLRRAAAVDQPHQLPDAVGRVRQHVPVRRQRPRHPGPPEPELQPAVPHDRDRVRGHARRAASRPTSRRPRSG